MGFPDEKVLIKRITAYDPAGISIQSIYPSGEYFDISADKEGALYLIPELDSPALEVFDNPNKLASGKFTVVDGATPNAGEVYVNPATGHFKFNAFEDTDKVWFFYTGYGSLVDADTYYNRVREVLHDLQDHLLTASGQRLQEIEATASGLADELVAVSGYLQSDIDNLWVYASGVNAAFVSASGVLKGNINDLHDELLAASGFLQGYTTSSYLNAINLINALSGSMSADLSSVSGHLQGQITGLDTEINSVSGSIQNQIVDVSGLIYSDIASTSGYLQTQINVNASGITDVRADLTSELAAASGNIVSYIDVTASGLNTQIIAESGRIDSHLADTANPHGVTYEQVGASPSGHLHDDRYYTESEVDAIFADYAALTYVDAQVSGLVDASGYLQGQITSNYNYLMDASGTLNTQIIANYNDMISGDAVNAAEILGISGYLQSQVTDNASGIVGVSGLILAHEALTNNPHQVTLEQARQQGNVLGGNIDMNSWRVTGAADPSGATDYATKAYVDALAISAAVAWQEPVLNTFSEPPVSPTEGDRYLIGAGASGAWSDNENKIVEWSSGAWVFATPAEGWRVWEQDDNANLLYNGSSWVSVGSTIDHGNLIGLADDDHPHYFNLSRLNAHLATWDDSIWLALTNASGRIDTNEADIASVSGVAAQNTSDIANVSGMFADYLPLNGGTMTGSVNMGDNNLTNVNNFDADSASIGSLSAGNFTQTYGYFSIDPYNGTSYDDGSYMRSYYAGYNNDGATPVHEWRIFGKDASGVTQDINIKVTGTLHASNDMFVNGNAVWHAGNDQDIMFASENRQVDASFYFASGIWFDSDYNTGWDETGNGQISFYSNGSIKANLGPNKFWLSSGVTIGDVSSAISEIWADRLMVTTSAPTASGSTGNDHEIRVDDEFVYFKGANGWLKIQGTLMPA